LRLVGFEVQLARVRDVIAFLVAITSRPRAS